MKTIVYAHPYEGSLNHALLNEITGKFKENQDDYQVLNLYADSFNPVLSSQDLYNYNQGISTDPLVEKYQAALAKTDELILIFPIWWYGLPAMLKGFLDRVMLPNVSYDSDDNGLLTGKLTNIKRATVLTTAGLSKKHFQQINAANVESTLINVIFKDLGIGHQSIRWFHYDTIHHAHADSSSYLESVIDKI